MNNVRAWTIREATRDDDAALAALFKRVFGFQRSEGHYYWKFMDNPAGKPIIVLAEDRGEVVGQYALWPVHLRLGPTCTYGAQSLDTMTHPDYRGQGMFTALAEECMNYAVARGIEVLFGFPNANSFPGFVKKLDWHHTGDTPIWVRPIKIGAHKRIPRWIAPAATVVATILPRGSISGYEIIERMPTLNELDLMQRTLSVRNDICRVDKSVAYLSWRFSHLSSMGYRYICALKGGELRALAIWGRDIRSGNALLGELLGRETGALRAVLASSIDQASAVGCPLMMAASSRSGFESILRRAGFFRRPSIPMIVRKLTAKTLGANIYTHANWEIFGADLDTF